MTTTTQIITPLLAMFEACSDSEISNAFVIGHIHRRIAEIQLLEVNGATFKTLGDAEILDMLLCRAFGESMSRCASNDAAELKAEAHSRQEVKRMAIRYMHLGRTLAIDLIGDAAWQEYSDIIDDAQDALLWAIREQKAPKAA